MENENKNVEMVEDAEVSREFIQAQEERLFKGIQNVLYKLHADLMTELSRLQYRQTRVENALNRILSMAMAEDEETKKQIEELKRKGYVIKNG